MLYIFAGFPRSGLNAEGIQHLVERVWEIGALEHEPSVQYTKENTEEVRMSDLCVEQGIEWEWFPERFAFGNGVTVFKSTYPCQSCNLLSSKT